MLPIIELFGHTILVGNVILFFNYAVVPPAFILLRKRYNYSIKKSLLLSVITLVFGYLAIVVTSAISNSVLSAVSNGSFDPYETTNSYGLTMFLSVFFCIFCLLFRKKFRTITDYAAPVVFFVNTLGKLVCVFNGCCYGPPDPNGIYLELYGFRSFPVQIYDTVNNFIIFIILMILTYTFSKKHVGYLLPIGGMLYAIEKGILEEFRVYENEWEGNFLGTGRTYWQFFLAILFIGALIWLIGTIIWEKKRKPDFDEAENIHLPDLSRINIKSIKSKSESSGKNKKKKNADNNRKR